MGERLRRSGDVLETTGETIESALAQLCVDGVKLRTAVSQYRARHRVSYAKSIKKKPKWRRSLKLCEIVERAVEAMGTEQVDELHRRLAVLRGS